MSKRQRAVVAMSGGVDSSVAAALLVERGYKVIGLMLRLWSEAGEGANNRCCTPEAVEDARRVARALGIRFQLFNYTGRVVEATLHPRKDGFVDVGLASPVRDVAPGQAAVFYQGEILLGGGIIAKEGTDDGTHSI